MVRRTFVEIVTRDSMIGVARLVERTMDGMHDMGGKQAGAARYTQNAQAFTRLGSARKSLYAFARRGIFNWTNTVTVERGAASLLAAATTTLPDELATLLVEKRSDTGTEQRLKDNSRSQHRGTGTYQRGRSPASSPAIAFACGLTTCRVMYEPGYIRGKTGVAGESPAYPFPDAHAHVLKAEDEPTYDVRFRSEDLWPN
jgi:nitrile hydratase